jgi:DNA-binding transcriptional regulator LsrR (DeoR family)
MQVAPETPPREDQLLLAARLYYIDGLTQTEVAHLAGVSQSKVSRLLAYARERGIVQITVPDYNPRRPELERRLRKELGLAEAIVIHSIPEQTAQDLRQSIGYFAGRLVSQWIAPASTVAVGGGRSMQALVQHMKPESAAADVTFIQTMGNIDSSPGTYDALELCRALAHRWSGAFLTLNAPALLPDAETCRRLLELEQVAGVFHRISKASLALVGIGTPQNSVFVERKVIGPREHDMLRKARAVGEIMGRFYDADGNELDTPLRSRVVSISFKELQRVRNVAAIVAGGDRAAAIRAAARGGLIKTLVIDERGARCVLGETQ